MPDELTDCARKAAEELWDYITGRFPSAECIKNCVKCPADERLGCRKGAINPLASIIERHMQPIVRDMIDAYAEQDNAERIFYATVEMKALDAERDAMLAANEKRREQGYSLFYNEDAFFELAEKYRNVKGATPCPR